MKRQLLTGFGIIEIGALAVLWRCSKAAPLLDDDLDDDVDKDVRPRKIRRRADCHRPTAHAG